MLTVESLLKQAKQALAHLDTPALDARLLLQHVTGLDHVAVVAEPGLVVDDVTANQFLLLVARRARHEPVSRIIGRREFYGRDFVVTPDVLDPRGDTEVLIEASLALLPESQPLHILDLGTGSGIVAVTLLAERPQATGVAVDVSAAALAVAGQNAEALGVRPRLQPLLGSWFENVTGRFLAIVSNPPYIEDEDVKTLAPDVKDYDPHLALAGGTDGLNCYRAIAKGAGLHLAEGGFVAVEIGAGQERDVTAIFARNGMLLQSGHRDLGGHVRCLVFRGAS